MKNNAPAIYLGAVGVLIAGLGLAYDSMPAADQPHATPLFVQTGVAQVPTPAPWPPANVAVAFHDETLELIAPRTRTASAPAAPQQAAPQREERPRTSRRRQAPDDADGRRNGRDRDEIEVIVRDGRRYRVERAEPAREPPGAARRYRVERELPPELRERDGMPDNFRAFGPFGR